jgi:2,3-bisphosphoglycerate-independent phosphoglycerate mutase
MHYFEIGGDKMPQVKPLVLMILDGWGYRKEREHNAIAQAHTPQWDKWWATCPHRLLEASGKPVGLPDAQMGNSEVGHMHIGSGRVVPQDFTRINLAIESGEFANNPVFIYLIQEMKQKQQAIHIMGLLSPGGVHSHENHLFAFIKLCAEHDFDKLCLHLFLDGRDTPPQSAIASIRRLEALLKQYPVAKICSLSGRYYAMDRDARWERVEPVYRLLTENESAYQFDTAELALNTFYDQDISDEFILPTRIGKGSSIHNGDAVFYFNFRSDRARELTHALVDDEFTAFKRQVKPELSQVVTMTQYSSDLATQVAFPPPTFHNTLGDVIAQHSLRQLRIAETEKYAHVTFFLNGGDEVAYPNEERILIPSPKVATYDLQPEMSAPELTRTMVEAINQHQFDVIICNYANADMVGHSGDFNATVKAIECLDGCMKDIGDALKKVDGRMLITADHGNAEIMYDQQSAQVQTAHTNLPVPLVFVGQGWEFKDGEGGLIDIAPTVLELLDIQPPSEMTGRSLMVKTNETTD